MKSNELLRKPNRKFVIGATLVVLAILHFTFSRFIAIEIEKDSTEIEAVNLQPAQNAAKPEIAAPEIIKDNKPETTEIIKTSDPAEPIRKAQPRKVDPKIETGRETQKETTIVKKKPTPRETRAERLRRTERMLTGV